MAQIYSGANRSLLTIHAMIYGRVQGVSYRYWTQAEARKRSLLGWVRNRRDGSVEAVFSGSDDDVDAMLEACWSGPMLASVSDIETRDYTDKIPESFDVLPTT